MTAESYFVSCSAIGVKSGTNARRRIIARARRCAPALMSCLTSLRKKNIALLFSAPIMREESLLRLRFWSGGILPLAQNDDKKTLSASWGAATHNEPHVPHAL